MSEGYGPLVSVVIPCYNHERFVQDCIQSVIDQTYENIELIIIDDGSKDSSVIKIQEMIAKCKARFTRFEFMSRSNKGLCETLNEALHYCNGEYYSTIASDDKLLPNKIFNQVCFLEENIKYVALFGGVNLIDEESNKIKEIVPSLRNLSFKNIFLSNYTILAPTQLIRMSSLKLLGENPYPKYLKIEDWYMWLKLSQIGPIVNVQEIVVDYRYHDTNISKNINLMQKGRFDVINEFRDNELYFQAFKMVDIINSFERKDFYNVLKIYLDFKVMFSYIALKKIISYFIVKS
ncbi:glycosyltransferase [Acinetobacter bereziniae]|uniref:glycosyltransferase family 2 protein n=1 Tax=Acinetobacter TaxID=469 RepID=UPI000EF67E30|nr:MULTISPECIES: glycosyltransferase [Acinetobacter]MBJ8423405.1 glycosyltransferase [Acinetobacter bereziniae]MCU4475544.1 glycosyltransferase [Acinetobacter bereziniae]MCU4542687.1 glycosyltransferase [Acinetobacter bereziniae]MCU4626321.1 glycosyltransferase [Acinetobacter bereziniae]BCX75975.1 glycosyl transferase [Acinetobacter sp. Tol 5]